MTQNILIIMDDYFGDDGLLKMLDSWGYKTHFLLKTDTNKIPEIQPDLVIMDVHPNDPEAETIVKQLGFSHNLSPIGEE